MLTPKQREQFHQLIINGPLFVGYNCPAIMKTFECLVAKGYAKVIVQYSTGKKYQVIKETK